MKRAIKKIAAGMAMGLILTASLTGCTKKTETQGNAVETPKDVSEGVTVKGSEITVVYKENPTTGYVWSYHIEDENIVKCISDENTQEHMDNTEAGRGSWRIFTFKTEKSGETAITMKYARNWEGGETEKEISLNVTVDDNGDVSVTEEE